MAPPPASSSVPPVLFKVPCKFSTPPPLALTVTEPWFVQVAPALIVLLPLALSGNAFHVPDRFSVPAITLKELLLDQEPASVRVQPASTFRVPLLVHAAALMVMPCPSPTSASTV